MTDTETTSPGHPFVHPALFYRTPDEYAAGVGGFVRDALDAGEPVLVAVPGGRSAVLREALGAGADGVEFADMTELGRNPGRILAALQGFADRYRGRPARIVGEPIWPGRSRSEVLEATRHEALINTAFAGRPATILCPYDVSGLPDAVVADARRTHPTLIENGRTDSSADYCDPAVVCADCDEPLPEPSNAPPLSYGAGQLGEVREHADAWARGTALSPGRRADLVLAVGEATANSLAHGGGRGTLRLWTTADGTVVAEVRDNGRLKNPLAGRRRPEITGTDGGRGLWIIHQLCDLVEVRAGATGLTLRLHFSG
ncbi:sensor histidine kinase [Streptantibioticus cattleyicolor]|uniref:Regulator of sigma factor n=1 Tax=Streptantibioticus cattleyicolor (strain ATCC 35852 / DSM 46488 / JCM 4925 / NBRC 14057 / NRRL 8057) TaxID=1003195 RepID=F8JMG9_STREN|nr:sensor histidine kinase [Streptantibioticus cattleyicolor]AEW99352.1 regulator of sigma factor [Streptantibioticus cattleyicolor NRRL 8057 = DSM 46488]CCB71607.1 Regulator of sigma factor [Streptantibioticus cattleyicolor NRRL 8057 = DSM 46488]